MSTSMFQNPRALYKVNPKDIQRKSKGPQRSSELLFSRMLRCFSKTSCKHKRKDMYMDKGQIISKCLFGVFNFLQKNERKQVDLRFHSSKVEFVCSFFGGNVSLKKSFQPLAIKQCHEGRKQHLRRPHFSKQVTKLAIFLDYKRPGMLCLALPKVQSVKIGLSK